MAEGGADKRRSWNPGGKSGRGTSAMAQRIAAKGLAGKEGTEGNGARAKAARVAGMAAGVGAGAARIAAGDVVGGALGAAKSVVSTPEGRKALAIGAGAMMLPLIMIAALLTGTTGPTGLMGSAINHLHAAYLDASSQAHLTQTDVAAYTDASAASGAPWEVPAVIDYYETGAGAGWGATPGTCAASSTAPSATGTKALGCPSMPTSPGQAPPSAPSASSGSSSSTTAASTSSTTAAGHAGTKTKATAPASTTTTTTTATTTTATASASSNCTTSRYVGPMQIACSALSPSEQAKAQGLVWSSAWIARAVQSKLEASAGWYSGLGLGSGVIYYQDGKAPAISASSQAAKTVRTDYLAALAALPVKGNSSTFDTNAFELAQDWYAATSPKAAAYTGSLGMACGVSSGKIMSVPTPGGGFTTLGATQLSNAAVTVHVAKSLGIPTAGAVIAIMTELTESTMYNLPNASVPGSETNPNVQWGGYSPSNPPNNGTSVGPFQQQNNWGSVTQRMTLSYSAAAFFGKPPGFPNHPPGLLQIPNWQSLPPGVAAQDVQVSAYPTRYAAWQSAADKIVGAVLHIPCSGSSSGSGGISVAGASAQAKKVIAAADKWVNKAPYVWGGGTASGPSGVATAPASQVGQPGFDCSGLVLYAFAQVGVTLPHYSGSGGQYTIVQKAGHLTTHISALKPGDLVFFVGVGDGGTRSNPGHVGIYIGNNQMINAPYTGHDVSIASFNSSSAGGFVGGGPV